MDFRSVVERLDRMLQDRVPLSVAAVSDIASIILTLAQYSLCPLRTLSNNKLIHLCSFASLSTSMAVMMLSSSGTDAPPPIVA